MTGCAEHHELYAHGKLMSQPRLILALIINDFHFTQCMCACTHSHAHTHTCACTRTQSFCSALNNELTEYYRLIAVLDAQSQQGSGALTLRRLLVWTHDPRERLQMLAVLVDGCKRK